MNRDWVIRDFYRDRDNVKFFEFRGDPVICFLHDNPVASFECFCGNRVRSPASGDEWKCLEIHGGCGSVYMPITAFMEVEE